MGDFTVTNSVSIGGGLHDVESFRTLSSSLSASLGIAFVPCDQYHENKKDYLKDFKINASAFLQADLIRNGNLLLGSKLGIGDTHTNASFITGIDPVSKNLTIGAEINPFGFTFQPKNNHYAAIGPTALILHDLSRQSTDIYVGVRIEM